MEKETSLFEKFKETGKHGIIFGIGGVLQKAIAFILLPVYTTRLAVSEYGSLGLLTTTGSILSVIFILGMNYGLFRLYFDYKDEKRRKALISTAFYIIVISNLTLFTIGFVFSRQLSHIVFGSYDYRLHFILITVITIFEIFNMLPSVILQAEKKSVVFISLQLTFLVIRLGLIIYLIISRGLGIMGVLIGNVSVGFLSCLVYYIYIRRELVARFLRTEAVNMLKIGLPLIPSSLSVFVFNSIDRYFLNYYTNLDEVGLYNLAYNFGNLVTVLFATPLALIWPAMFLSVKNHKNIKEFYTRAFTYTSFIAFFIFLAISLLSKEAIEAFANEEYWAAYSVVPIIVLTYAIWALRKNILVAVILKKKTQSQALIFFVGAVINIGLNFLLIPRYGIMGAASSTIITYIIIMIILFIYSWKLMEVNFEWFRVFKIIMVTAAIFCTGYFINIESTALSVIFKVFIIILYPFLLYPLRFYKESEIERVKRVIRSGLKKIRRKK
jgi:O-antigen/teichoic acid export membrane protein